MIVTRKTSKGKTRHQVRVWREGVWTTVGTFDDRSRRRSPRAGRSRPVRGRR
jgi:hypothetical protein